MSDGPPPALLREVRSTAARDAAPGHPFARPARSARPKLSLALARRLATHLAALAAFGAMASGGELPVLASGLFLAAVALSLAKGDRVVRGLAVWLTVAVAGANVVLLLLVAQGAMDLVLAASLFGAAVCLHRLLGRRGPQDDPLLLLTTLMMLAAGAALSGEAAYGLCFAVYGAAVTAALTFSHLERAAAEANLPGPARDALISRNLVGALAALSLAAVLGAAAVFVFFPRLNAQWIGRHAGIARSPQIGFQEQVQLGGIGTLRDDPRPALRIRFPDLDAARLARLVEGPDQRLDLLWRAQSLDTFDGHGWSASRGARHRRRMAPTTAPEAYGIHAEVEVLPVAATNLVFSPGRALAAHLLHNEPVLNRRNHFIMQRGSGDFAVEPAPSEMYAYEVWTAPADPGALRGRGRDYPEEIARQDLQLPPLDPRIPALARSWVGTATDPADQAAAIARHLRSGFRYTTRLPGASADPVASFLFDRKEGHCEYFSSAMVLMLRSLGIPSREVTGFSGGVPAPGSDYFIVRVGDAHSWAEAYLPGLGFVPFDPTPPSAREEGPHGLGAYWAEVTDAAAEWWRRHVVDYDLRSQIDALRAAGRALAEVNARFSREATGDHGSPAFDWRKLALGGLALALATSVALRLRRRRRAALAEGGASAVAYARMLRALERRAVPRLPSETARELAARLERAARPEAGPVRAMAELYERERFAGAAWSAAERAEAVALLAALR